MKGSHAMVKVAIPQRNKIVAGEAGKNLLALLMENGIFLENPCGGNGRCGKCRVRILAGDPSPITETEARLLGKEEIERGARLSCMVKLQGDLQIELSEEEQDYQGMVSGYMPDFEPDQDGERNGYGAAVDVGTTTAALSLAELSAGAECAAVSTVNAQKRFGSDVLTRITYEMEHPQTGVRELQKAIVDSVNGLLAEACAQAGIRREQIRKITVAANCTMMHMLLGISAVSLGRAPFTPVFAGSKRLKAADIGLLAAPEAELYCLPAVSAYVGADIVAGAYVCQMHKAKGNVLFLDIGTNGELVLACGGRLLACSCAAGPALEGMNIRSGMRASCGAVENVRLTKDGVALKVIGGGEPRGICGSGILSAVRELLAAGLVRKSGAFLSAAETDMDMDLGTDVDRDPHMEVYRRLRTDGTRREFVLYSAETADGKKEIVITQNDVRQVQLAKGAILSGFCALLEQSGITAGDLDRVVIAGQFGANLSADDLIGTGILPPQVRDKLFYVGNAAKTGAYLALMSQKARGEMEELASQIESIELGETADYERLFARCLIFPDTTVMI